MSRKPTNFTLLDPNKVPWALMKPVTVADAFEGQTNNLNDQGLYSTEIFGRVGTAERDTTISYIDVTLPIFNPTYFKALIQLKSLYGEIIKGRAYATWDPVEKDFIKSNLIEGETGFAFFMSHFYELDPKQNESFKRKQKIDLVDKFKSQALSSNVIVIPAGIRDIEFTPNGTGSVVTENEVNDLYRKLIFRSKSLNIKNIDTTDPVYDGIRWGLQESFNNIADFFFNMQEGKRGFMQRRMSRRAIFGATRNVITSRKVSVEDCDNNVTGDPNSTIIGLFQALLGFNLVAIHQLTNGFLNEVFTSGMGTARLVDPKTLNAVYVEVGPSVVDKFTSSDGLTSMFNGYGSPNLRNRDIKISGHYLGLVYDDGKDVMLLHDIDDLPEGLDRKLVRPVTYTQFFYMQCVPEIEKKMLQVTRYPITGIGSIYPSRVFVMPTNSTSSSRNLLDLDGQTVITKFNYFPTYTKNPSYFDGMSIANIRIGLAGADFDGDALSANSIMAEDSIREVEKLFGKRDFYISGSGDFLYDPVQEPHEFLLRSLTNGLA